MYYVYIVTIGSHLYGSCTCNASHIATIARALHALVHPRDVHNTPTAISVCFPTIKLLFS